MAQNWIYRDTDTELYFETYNLGNMQAAEAFADTLKDDLLENQFIEIRVYS